MKQLLKAKWGKENVKQDVVLPDPKVADKPYEFAVNDDLLVEFHDARHFTYTETIWADEQKKIAAVECCKRYVTIPYFIQLNPETFSQFFDGEEAQLENWVASGFGEHDVLPTDFNSYGEELFMHYYRAANGICKIEILDSLSELQKDAEYSVFGQTLVFKELVRPASLRNFYSLRLCKLSSEHWVQLLCDTDEGGTL